MGLSLKGLGKSLEDVLSAAGHGINPFDNGQGWTNQASQAGPPIAQPAVQAIQNAKFGVLANNPAAQQNLIANSAPSTFNAPAAGLGAAWGYAKSIPAGIVNTAQMAPDVARIAAANVTNNPVAAMNARTALGSDEANNLFTPDVPFLRSTATAVLAPVSQHYANIEANRAQQELQGSPLYDPETEALNIRQNFLQDELARAGINQNDSKATVIRKIGAQGGQLALNTLLQSQMGNNFADALKGTAPDALASKSVTLLDKAKPYVMNATKTGAINAGTNVLGVAQQDNANARDYTKAVVTGFGTGAAQSLGMEAAGQLLHPIVKIANNPNRAVVNRLLAKPMSTDEHNTLKDYIDYKTGGYKAKGAEANLLIKQARSLGQRYGVDLTSGSPREIGQRAYALINMSKRSQGGYVGSGEPSEEAQAYAHTFNIPVSQAAQELEQTKMTGNLEQISQSGKARPAAEIQTAIEKAHNAGSDAEVQKLIKQLPEDMQSSMRSVFPEVKSPASLSPALREQLNPSKPRTLSPTERAGVINSQEGQQTKNKVSIAVPEGNTRGAIARATGIEQERQARFQRANTLGKKLSLHDQQLLAERADPNIKVNPDNPKAFGKAAQALDDAYDYHLAANRAAGGTTLRFGEGKYAPLYLKATPEQMDAMKIPNEERYTAGQFTGFRDTARKYRSYTDAGKVGLEPLNESPLQDMKTYAQSSHGPMENALLEKALSQSNPKDVAGIGEGVNAKGQKFTQAAGRLNFNASPELQKALQNFQAPYSPKSLAGKVAMKAGETANTITKKSLFLGTPFHYMNITKNFEGLSALTGHELVAGKGLATALANAGTKEGYQAIVDHYRQTGTLEQARAMGIILPERSRMDRFINGYALTLADAARKHGIDPSSQTGTDLGQMYNKVLGRMNDRVEGTNPTLAKMWSNASLAPHYMRTQLALVKDSLTKKGTPIGLYTPGGVARGTVAGARALEALAAITTSAIIAGQLPTWGQAANQAGLNPNNPVPNVQLKSKNKSGHGQVMDLPTDPAGLAVGLATDPKHFIQSRVSPVTSFATKVATNTNWNGQPLADMSQPNAWLDRIKNAAENSVVPIGVQNFTNLQGNPNNPSVAQGIAQEFGGRLKTDPNDPGVIAAKKFYDDQAKFRGALNKNEQAMFDTLNPSKKAADGTTIFTTNLLTKPADYKLLQANPGFLAKYQAYQAAQQGHDPLWDLPSKELNAYINVQELKSAHGTATGAGALGGVDKKYVSDTQGSDWYQALSKARNGFFDALSAKGVKLPPSASAVTQPSDAVSKVLDQLGKPGVNSASLIDQNPEAEAYLSQHADEINQNRADIGLPPLPKFPAPANDTIRKQDITYNALPQGTGARSKFLKANPDYFNYYQQKQSYYSTVDGTTNTSASNANSYTSKSYVSRSQARLANPYNFVSDTGGGDTKIGKARVVAKVPTAPKLAAKKGSYKAGRPKVSLRRAVA